MVIGRGMKEAEGLKASKQKVYQGNGLTRLPSCLSMLKIPSSLHGYSPTCLGFCCSSTSYSRLCRSLGSCGVCLSSFYLFSLSLSFTMVFFPPLSAFPYSFSRSLTKGLICVGTCGGLLVVFLFYNGNETNSLTMYCMPLDFCLPH